MPKSNNIVSNNKSIEGALVGILVLEAYYTRIRGDLGNATTWPFPVLYHVVKGATPEKVVLRKPAELLPDFINGAQRLVRLGAEIITTSCGFLSLFQKELSEAVGVPVFTSSLMQVPWIQATLPISSRVGIVTISSKTLTLEHLRAVGVPLDTPIAGTEEGCEFFPVIIRAIKNDLNVDLARQDVVKASLELMNRQVDIGAIVLECTNMSPYAAAVADATGLPVYDIYSLINWARSGLCVGPRMND